MLAPQEQAPAAFDVEVLLTKGGEILNREIRSLMQESSGGKLSAASARDLVSYLKLLSELRDTQAKELGNLTDEELAALTQQKR